MKIMKVLDKKVGDTTYFKYRVNLPKEVVEKLKLVGTNVQVKEDRGRIVIEKE